jgi:orotate phosphoribosyltransferase
MTNIDILKILEKVGAFLKGHFLLSSGLHSEKYLQCAILLSYPDYAKEACGELALKFKSEKIDVVIGPAYGGIIVAYELARALGARAFFTERKDGIMQLRRNFSIKENENVLIAEDVITTGKSVNEVIDVVKVYKPKLVAVAVLIDRSGKDKPFGDIRLESLAKIDIKTYEPQDCPLCKKNIPLVKPGSRKN